MLLIKQLFIFCVGVPNPLPTGYPHFIHIPAFSSHPRTSPTSPRKRESTGQGWSGTYRWRVDWDIVLAPKLQFVLLAVLCFLACSLPSYSRKWVSILLFVTRSQSPAKHSFIMLDRLRNEIVFPIINRGSSNCTIGVGWRHQHLPPFSFPRKRKSS